jgi:hypothetical protein
MTETNQGDSRETEETEEFADILSSEPIQEEVVQQETEAPEKVTEPSDDIPEKYLNKDIKDIIRMHQEAEKALGKQSNEVGELRKVFDDYVKSQTITAESKQSQNLDIDEEEYWTNPKEAVSKSIDSHPDVIAAREAAAQLKQQQAIATLKASHGDFESIISDQGFIDWVGKSKVRKDLLSRAHTQFDVDAADELFTNWKERRDYVTQTKQENKAKTKKMVQKASVGGSGGTSEPAPKKLYRNRDIQLLAQNDPERYKRLLPELMRAYQEGRVQ